MTLSKSGDHLRQADFAKCFCRDRNNPSLHQELWFSNGLQSNFLYLGKNLGRPRSNSDKGV